MQAACIASLLLALSACTAAAEPAQLHDDRQLLQTQQASRHLLQGPGCPGPDCRSSPAQTGPAQMAGPGGGAAGAGAGAGSTAARAVPSASPVAGAASSPGLSPDGMSSLVAQQAKTCLHALAAKVPPSCLFALCVVPHANPTSWLVGPEGCCACCSLGAPVFPAGHSELAGAEVLGFQGVGFHQQPLPGLEWSLL